MDSNYKGNGLDFEYESVHLTLPLYSYNFHWLVAPTAPGTATTVAHLLNVFTQSPAVYTFRKAFIHPIRLVSYHLLCLRGHSRLSSYL